MRGVSGGFYCSVVKRHIPHHFPLSSKSSLTFMVFTNALSTEFALREIKNY